MWWVAHRSKEVTGQDSGLLLKNKWGLGHAVRRRLYKGTVEPLLLKGVAVWGETLESEWVIKQLTSVQRRAELAMRRCLKLTRTMVALALSGLTRVDLVGREMVIQQNTPGTMKGRVVALQGGCE